MTAARCESGRTKVPACAPLPSLLRACALRRATFPHPPSWRAKAPLRRGGGKGGRVTKGLFPNGFAGAGESQARPFLADRANDLIAHADFAAPFALHFGRPFGGRVEPDLGAETGFGRCKIEIIDRRPLDDYNVAGRIHARRDRPHHVFPIPRVDAVIHYNDPFGV